MFQGFIWKSAPPFLFACSITSQRGEKKEVHSRRIAVPQFITHLLWARPSKVNKGTMLNEAERSNKNNNAVSQILPHFSLFVVDIP